MFGFGIVHKKTARHIVEGVVDDTIRVCAGVARHGPAGETDDYARGRRDAADDIRKLLTEPSRKPHDPNCEPSSLVSAGCRRYPARNLKRFACLGGSTAKEEFRCSALPSKNAKRHRR